VKKIKVLKDWSDKGHSNVTPKQHKTKETEYWSNRRPKRQNTKVKDDQCNKRPKWQKTKATEDQSVRGLKQQKTKVTRGQSDRRPKWQKTKVTENYSQHMSTHMRQNFFSISSDKRATCFKHLCRKTTVLSCHKCLLNTGVDKINNI